MPACSGAAPQGLAVDATEGTDTTAPEGAQAVAPEDALNPTGESAHGSVDPTEGAAEQDTSPSEDEPALEQPEAAATRALERIERRVGALQEVVGIGLVLGANGAADAHPRAHHVAVDRELDTPR